MHNQAWYRLKGEQVLAALGTAKNFGLDALEARRRLARHGPNKLPEKAGVGPVVLFLNQFGNFMIVVLLAATAVSAFLGEVLDAATILAIVFLNAVLGFAQEYRAERSLQALKELAAPQATVIRGGRVCKIPAAQVVPGDILCLEAGDRVAADARLLEASSLEVDESLLTGESVPVAKRTEPLEGDVPVAEQVNMVFQGTTVTRGRGLAVVVATGKQSEIGQLAELLRQSEDEDTPLQKRMADVGRWLVLVCLALCAVVFVVGLWRGLGLYPMLLAGVSLAVAAIPEGLPAVVTVCLALGVQRMLRRRAIVRRLPAVETLGCTTVICSDKTGTLTQNQMTVRRIFAGGRYYEVSGEGYETKGKFSTGGKELASPDPDLLLLLKAGVLCNNAVLQRSARGGWQVVGDPTEGALVVCAAKAGIRREDVEAKSPRTQEIPFSAERRRMAVVCRGEGGQKVLYAKGAAESLLPLCTGYYQAGKILPFTAEQAAAVQKAEREMAAQALRVLALAFRPLPKGSNLTAEEMERDLVLLGLVGMLDPPRPAAYRALELCREAGIRVLMVTGDHRNTAWAIAKELKLAEREDEVVSGAELDALSDQELAVGLEKWRVLARVSPQHKLRLVRALKACGHVVAMTGDGVNDAPAVKEADIGVAMGVAGAEVTKEAAAMVLADDNFATIVAAVEEGRSVYSNIRKFVRYLLSCNLGEVLTMLGALVVGLPLPLVPIQILWMNLVTDGLPALALAVDPAAPDLMRRPPRPPEESLFAGGLAAKILGGGFQIALGTLAVFLFALWAGRGDVVAARTMAFTTLVFFQLFYVFICRAENAADLTGMVANRYLDLAVLLSAVMQVLVVQWFPLQVLFHTVPLRPWQWALIFLVSGGTFGLQRLGGSLAWRQATATRQ